MKRKISPQKLEKLNREVKDLLENYDLTHGMGRALRLVSKEVSLFENHIAGIKAWGKNENRKNKEKIQIGGGVHVLNDFLNIDIVPPADLICDVRESLPLEDKCCNFIFSEHFLEHIDYPTSVKKFIRECYRILKPGGQLVIGVPDSELVIKNYIKRDKRFWKLMLKRWYSKRNCLKDFNTYIDLVNYHFRDQDDDKKYNLHFWAYDFEKLTQLLRDIGFSDVRKWKFDSNIANPKREWGSLYVIATK